MNNDRYYRVRLTYHRTLPPDRIVETEEYATSPEHAVALAAAREGNPRELWEATVEACDAEG